MPTYFWKYLPSSKDLCLNVYHKKYSYCFFNILILRYFVIFIRHHNFIIFLVFTNFLCESGLISVLTASKQFKQWKFSFCVEVNSFKDVYNIFTSRQCYFWPSEISSKITWFSLSKLYLEMFYFYYLYYSFIFFLYFSAFFWHFFEGYFFFSNLPQSVLPDETYLIPFIFFWTGITSVILQIGLEFLHNLMQLLWHI